jgi:hypothetical protein
MTEINETLTSEVLKRVQQHRKQIERRIDGVEAELGAVRSRAELQAVRNSQVAMLEDLDNIYRLVARHHIQLSLLRSTATQQEVPPA